MPQTSSTTTKAQDKESKIKTFESFLLENKLLTDEQLRAVHKEQAEAKTEFESALISSKIFDEDKLVGAKSKYFNLPFVDLRVFNITKEVLGLFSKESLENYEFIPFQKQGKTLKVALIDPTNLQALEALEFFGEKRRFNIEIYLTSPASYRETFQKTRTITTEVGEALEVIQEKEKARASARKPEIAEKKETNLVSESPVIRIVDVIIKHAIEARASDIHIEPQENDLRIRYRIDGVLQSSLIIPKIVHPAIVSRIKILSNLKIDEQRIPQDGRFHMDVEKRSIDFRISTLPTVNGEKVVMRILDKSGGVPTLEDLGLTGMKLKRLIEIVKKPHGMLLITGPTGSGKSTTLYAILNILNKVGVNIVTLEDPVEYFIGGVNQAQINPDVGLTFASGLRSILRQDPNIIMVGEIRDRETAELGVHSALTGHLVFSTLHTNDAIGAIPRLVDMGIEEFLLTASVNAVMAQRLVRRICQKCKKEEPMTEEVKKKIRSQLDDIPAEEAEGLDLTNMKQSKGEGCKYCGNTGYQGRIGIFEVLPVSEAIRACILNKDSITKMLETARKEGMITMIQDGWIKVIKGQTTIEEVLRVTKT